MVKFRPLPSILKFTHQFLQKIIEYLLVLILVIIKMLPTSCTFLKVSMQYHFACFQETTGGRGGGSRGAIYMTFEALGTKLETSEPGEFPRILQDSISLVQKQEFNSQPFVNKEDNFVFCLKPFLIILNSFPYKKKQDP